MVSLLGAGQYSEKYALVVDQIRLRKTSVLPFIQEHLGEEAVAELKKIWQEGAKPVPENASDEEKYEVAYGILSGWVKVT